MFDPLAPAEEVIVPGEASVVPHSRRNHLSWLVHNYSVIAIRRKMAVLLNTHHSPPYRCECSSCEIKTTETECLCCREVNVIKSALEDFADAKCITLHPGFETVCLNLWVLETAYYGCRQQYVNQVFRDHSTEEYVLIIHTHWLHLTPILLAHLFINHRGGWDFVRRAVARIRREFSSAQSGFKLRHRWCVPEPVPLSFRYWWYIIRYIQKYCR